ncbi:MAG: hypothetical protein AAFO82_07965 [Bacteroidota bacterium]
MKLSKIFFALAFVLFGTLAIAQSSQQQAMEEVGLTEEEMEQVKEADKEYKEAIKTLHKNKELTGKDKGAQTKKLREARKSKVAEIMGEERYKKFQELTAEKRTVKKGKRDAAMADMELTEEQEAKLKEIRTKYQKEAVSLRMDKNMSAEDKRAKAKELRKAQNADMKAVLSPEQYTKYQEMKKEQRAQRAERKQ